MGKGIVFITGASSGIGKALAHEFARRGYDIGLLARRLPELELLASDLRSRYRIRAEAAALDVAQDDTVRATIDALREKMGGLDIMVANAGVTAVNRTGAGDISKDKRVIAVNLVGAIATLDAAAHYFRERKAGTLVGISSIAGIKPIPGSGTYSASKAALSSWLRAARAELAKHKVAVVAIHPGFIRTELVPGMEKYPFVIEAEPAARAMVDAIEAKKASVIVPAWPWKVLMPLANLLPDSVTAKMF